jgi:DTW domain-containing protein YfiP
MSRKTCGACRRPIKSCLCGFIQSQNTKLPVLIVQHPDESNHPFTTAYLASLGASSVQLCCALDLTEQQCRSLLHLNPADDLALLYIDHHYDEHDARTIDCLVPESIDLIADLSGLVVLDGTWRNTRELLLRNTWLATLTTLSLKNLEQSEYTIRKGEDNTVCTLEAIDRLLRIASPKFQSDLYLRPMRELVRQQDQFRLGASSSNS